MTLLNNKHFIFIFTSLILITTGCQNGTEKSEEDYKKCFNEKIKRFVSKKFNTNIDVNLSGKQKIYVLNGQV